MIYYDNADLTVLDSSIRWTTEEVQNADTRIYSPEFENPVSLNSIFNAVGTGSMQLYCFYRMSPAKLLGSIALNIRGKSLFNFKQKIFTFKNFDYVYLKNK